MFQKKIYLGDGAYVNFDGYHIVLTTENGVCATDTVCLEPHVLEAFLDYVSRLKEYITQERQKK